MKIECLFFVSFSEDIYFPNLIIQWDIITRCFQWDSDILILSFVKFISRGLHLAMDC